jgi:hypothetical protein
MTRLFLTLIAVAAVAELTARYSDLMETTWLAPLFTAILLAATLIIYRLISQIDDAQRFTQVYLVSIVGKILLACILIVILIIADKPHARANVLFLFSMYVLFTVIEVLFLIRLRRTHSGAKKNQKISF